VVSGERGLGQWADGMWGLAQLQLAPMGTGRMTVGR